MKRRLVMLGAAALAIGAAAFAEDAPKGYLQPGQIDLLTILPPAPTKGDIRYESDRQVFKAMKPLIGSPRWDYAKADVPTTPGDVMKDMSCATGIALSPEAQPATYRLLARASTDTARENNRAKDYYKRLRPFLIDKGEICETDRGGIGKTFDYPSGHTTRGWTEALLLAELLPARATQILARGRAYGESRLVCRVHNMSAVEAGRVGATSTVEAMRAMPDFQADLAAARAELASGQPAPDATACQREQQVVWPSVLAGLKAK